MENRNNGNSSNRVSFDQVDEDDWDFALATIFGEQEGDFTRFAIFESESESDASEEFSNDNNFNCFGFEGEGEGEFLEGHDDSSHEEDDINPDELSYEELITLGEIIGVEKRGLSPKEISSCLRVVKFRFGENKSEIDRCVVCQLEYEEGESLAALCCGHLYHSECICQWLQIKKVCPICGTEISSSISFS